jgi:hypothetical protein
MSTTEAASMGITAKVIGCEVDDRLKLHHVEVRLARQGKERTADQPLE